MLTRRFLLTGAVAGTAAALVSLVWCDPLRASTGFAVQYTDAQWRARLAPARYAVLRQQATEPPFSSRLLHEQRRGGVLQPLRRPPRPSLSRWPATDRSALLHERPRAGIQARMILRPA